MRKINKESSSGANIAHNGGINVDTGASARTTSTEDGQTLLTHKLFAYYKKILIAEQSLFCIGHGERVSGEAA